VTHGRCRSVAISRFISSWANGGILVAFLKSQSHSHMYSKFICEQPSLLRKSSLRFMRIFGKGGILVAYGERSAPVSLAIPLEPTCRERSAPVLEVGSGVL